MRFLLFLSVLIPNLLLAQNPTAKEVKIEKLGEFKLDNSIDDWKVNIQHHKIHAPDGNSTFHELQRRKQIIERLYPRKNNSILRNDSLPLDSFPILGEGFIGNLPGTSTPNDNNIAISDSGMMISVVNTSMYVYDLNNDTLLYDKHMSLFLSNYMTLFGSKFDPKVIYDPSSDRFIMLVLNGSSVLSSKYVACFSTTNNPMDPWHVYAIPGNPLNDNSWSDYPAIALTKEDVFLTINLLEPNGSWQTSFKQSIIWQINKESGHNGNDTLNSKLWYDIAEGGINIRNIHPVRAARGDYADNIYLLSNRNFAIESDSIYLIEITDTYNSGNAQINIDLIHSDDNYYLTKDAPQTNWQSLATNDNRVLGGTIEDGIIQFVQNGTDTTTGNTCIFKGRLDVANKTCSGYNIADPVLNFGYANIASTAVNPGEHQSIVTFEYTSDNHYPGMAAVYMNDDWQYGKVKIVKQGENYISVFNDSLERWGDYSGIQQKYNEPCKVWANATYGGSDNRNRTWIVELMSDSTCREPSPILPPEPADSIVYNGEYNGKIFPNPVYDMLSFALTADEDSDIVIDVMDMRGRLVKQLYNGMVKQGENILSFTNHYLNNGMYVLWVKKGDEVLYSEKFVVE